MDFLDVVAMGQQFLTVALWLVAPVVAVSLVVGLLISIAQTVTSIQEQTLSFAPRIVAVVFVLIWMMPWYLETLKNYTQGVLTDMVSFVK
jgi:flagellar biosynthetic protein FliQ